jgi:hypothetical protein
VGCDTGGSVTEEYRPLAAFTGKIVQVKVDLKPDFVRDVQRESEAQVKHAMVRQ